MKKYLIVLAVLSISFSGFSQNKYSEINRRRVNLLAIDTLESFIYETKQARIYFSQQDIEQIIGQGIEKDKGYVMYQFLLDTLKLNRKRILVREDTIYDKAFLAQRTSAQINGTPFPILRDKRDYLNELFMFLAADLMMEGKCLPYSKVDKKFYTKRIILKRRKGIMGNRYLAFLFPNKTEFYSIVTTLGE